MGTDQQIPASADWDHREAAFYISKFAQVLEAINDVEACDNEYAVVDTVITHIVGLGFSNAMISLLRPEEKPPTIRGTQFFGDEWESILPITVRPYPGQDLLPCVLRDGTEYVPDSRKDKRNDTLAIGQSGIISQFVVALQTRDMKIGTLQVHFGNRPKQPVVQCQILEALGAHASLAIGRIRSVIRLRDADTKIMSFSMVATAGAVAAGVVHELKGEMGAAQVELARLLKEQAYRHQGKVKALLERQLQRVIQWSNKIQNPMALLSDNEDCQTCSVNQIVLEVIANWHWDAETRNCRLAFRPYIKRPVNLYIRPSHLLGLLSCLVINALQAHARNVTVTLNEAEVPCCDEENDVEVCAVITVADDGTGIAEHHRERVFELGFTTKQRGGTGYGLYFAGHLAAAMSGCLTLESAGRASGQPETIFKLVIPVERNPTKNG